MLIDKYKLSKIINDPNKKSYPRIIMEAINAGIIEKELPRHYFSKFLYRKVNNNYLDYVSSFRGVRIQDITREDNSCLASILENKVFFNEYFKGKEIVIPNMIGFNHKTTFIRDDISTSINNYSEFISMIKNWGGNTGMFIKPIDGSQGKDCYMLTNQDNKNIETIYEQIVNGNYIFHEIINQHDEINQIYREAINPIRIATYLDEHGDMNIVSAFMTFGINDTDVSNNSSGGIFVPVDFKKGILKDTAVQYLEYGGIETKVHPNSNFVFDGFQIPYFEETIEIITQALEYLPAKLVGWDIAITDNGPCIIEGNSGPAMASLDIGYGGLKKHPIFGDVIKKFY